jgi:DNA-directed RNA polymerase subunit M/transcription elongation factor TFIIS
MKKKKDLFCDDCGKIMNIVKTGDKQFLICFCGFAEELNSDVKTSETHKITLVGEGVAKKQKSKGFPHKCKKCGYNGCDVYDLGAPYSDESNVYLFQCRKCGYVERQADGSGNR